MSLTPGTHLGVYEVTEQIGAGGMGEVYRASDTKLNRDVALKILPDIVAQDPERLGRFKREAQLLAALNHPHIGAIYGFDEAGDRHFLVLELIDGETLAERIARGPLPVPEALAIAKQIAEALEAAHEKGIIHRDLKPANVKITADGKVKVLDFGLAKAMEKGSATGEPGSARAMNSPTLSLMATEAGLILGTAAYMSPEQAKGFATDQRTDVFSFGCVLYEMLSGRKAFDADTATETLAAVLLRDADLTALPGDLSLGLRALVVRCLEKNPKRRWHAIGDVRYEIEAIVANPQGASSAPPVSVSATWRRCRAPVEARAPGAAHRRRRRRRRGSRRTAQTRTCRHGRAVPVRASRRPVVPPPQRQLSRRHLSGRRAPGLCGQPAVVRPRGGRDGSAADSWHAPRRDLSVLFA